MVAYDYLNRSDRILFCDPLPDLDDDWLLYPGLDRDTISEIADYMSTETPDLFGILTSGIRDGLQSKNIEIRNAANVLKPVLKLEDRPIVNAEKPTKNFRKIFQSIKSKYTRDL